MGLVKEKDGAPVRDKAREADVISNFIRDAKSLGVDGHLATKLAIDLIDNSVRIQNKSRGKSLSGKKALVVGGSGKMGEWTCRFLSDRGAAVRIWDPRGKLPGYKGVKSLKSGVSDADIVVVASPLGVCPAELGAVIDASPKGLVFDLCSVKSHVAGRITEATRAGTRITSVHPMFGASAASPKGRNVLVCECGCEEADDEAEELFSSSGAHVSRLTLGKHDELMAYVLGLSHLCTLMFVTTLQRSGESADRYAPIQGPSFKKMSKLAIELSRESRRVYHDIQALNPHTRQVISSMEGVLRDLRKAALDSDHRKFSSLMESSKTYLEVK